MKNRRFWLRVPNISGRFHDCVFNRFDSVLYSRGHKTGLSNGIDKMKQSADIVKRVKETIDRFSLVDSGDSILIGLSGGPDSVALTDILKRAKKSLNLRLGAIYINHGIRPREAVREEAFCREMCDDLGIPFYSETVDIPGLAQSEKNGIEETARLYRYRILEAIAKKHGFAKIAVGHHSDDRVETILFNLFRGAGRNGIIGFQPKRGNIIRPLYDLSRGDILTYLRLEKLAYRIDSSNKNTDYTRNRIRLKILPKITELVSVTAPANILRCASLLQDEERFLSEYASKIYRELSDVTPGGKNRLDLSHKLAYDTWLTRRLLILLLTDAGVFDIDFAMIDRLLALIDTKKGQRLQLTNDRFAEISGSQLYVYSPVNKMGRTEVHIPGNYTLDYPRLRITLGLADREMGQNFGATDRQSAFVDFDRLREPFFFSGLQKGAKFHAFGRPGSKKAGDFLTDRKYPRPLRDELPVLYDAEGIVWLAGIEIDNRVAVTDKTRKIVKIEIGRY